MSALGRLPVSLLGKCGDLAIDLHSVIPLTERDGSWWLKLTTAKGIVEGKLHLPRVEPARLIVFQPGFPGGGSTDFETHHLDDFLASGYTVFAIRHNGSLLNGLHSDYYISCPERQKKALVEKQQYLGERRDYSIRDWLLEPFIVVEALGLAFQEIVLVGHSFGGLSLFSSMQELVKTQSQNLGKLKRIVSLAGATGRIRSDDDPILQQWSDYLDTDWARERVLIGSPEDNVKHLQDAYRAVHQWHMPFPETTQPIFVSPWGDTTDSTDEYTTPQEALDMIITLGRGTFILDKTQKSDSETGALAHDMSNLSTGTYIKLVDCNWIPERQIMCLDHAGLR